MDLSSTSNENQELQLANDFVEQTGCNIFLTGKAGTGKTTFLKNLHQTTSKNMIITAPTGVAAINAGGVTLHSFFQLPLGPFVPGSEAHEKGNRSTYRFTREKQNIVKSLDLLVIDEISMVRADVLDAVDSVMQRYRSNNLPFGGVQLLMIGDLHQLPPVAKREEWDLLRQYYHSVYFFSSRALARSSFISIELKYIYRQTDEKFIKILNQLRENSLDALSLSELNSRLVKDYIPENNQGYITLTTHNAGAESMNDFRLEGLKGESSYLPAEIKGEFQKNSYPAPEVLCLKKGAQVMFLRNDTSSEKSYYNGKIGKVTEITNEKIKVHCRDSSKAISVEPVVWENIRYSVDKKTMKIEQEVIGTFKQFPLKLAWAITIHKSQGLTFEKAIIDSADAFAHGQTYVALSRCRSLDGVILSSPISPNGIEIDAAIKEFERHLKDHPPSQEYLQSAIVNFQQNLLLECFDFKQLKIHFNKLARLLFDHSRTIRYSGFGELQQTLDNARLDIFEVSEKFKRQLQNIFQNGHLPESDPQVLERLSKASVWFQGKISEILKEPLEDFYYETDNSILEAKLKDTLMQLAKEIVVKLEGIKALQTGFNPADYQRKIQLALLGQTSLESTGPAGGMDDDHPELVKELKKWRLKRADIERTSKSRILAQAALVKIAKALPENLSELRKIESIGEKTIKRRGKDLISIVKRYRKKYRIKKGETVSSQPQKSEKKKEKVSQTKQTSFEMLRSGLTIEEIAEKRELKKTTIEGHLCFYVEQGKVDINRFIPIEKQAIIKEKLKTTGSSSLSAVKEQLGDDYSYGEIRMVFAQMNYQESLQGNKVDVDQISF